VSSEFPRNATLRPGTSGITTTPLSPFLCPGSSQPVTRSIHLARLNAAWPECDRCEWRHDTEGLAEKTVATTERIRDQRSTGIQRTEFGIRGQYINDLDRRTTSELARLFCFCLNENQSASESPETIAVKSSEHWPAASIGPGKMRPADMIPPAVNVSLVMLSPLVVGYDGRNSSPDIFVGVSAAAREFGLPIVDIGRCTAASLQEAARSQPDCCGAMFVTGAGSPVSWIGLDVLDAAGDPIPVIWKDFGVRLQHVSMDASGSSPAAASAARVPDDRLTEMLHRMRSHQHPDEKREAAFRSQLRLVLPPLEERSRWMARLSRHSGTHQILDFEQTYRQWLTRWYPEKQGLRIQVRSDDVLIQQRVAWLAEHTGLELIGRSVHDHTSIPACQITITIEEDDRCFTVENTFGEKISPDRLAAMINVAIHSQASQVTAHTDHASGRFWLTDSGRTSAGQVGSGHKKSVRSTEHVRDALAVLGLLCRLILAGRMNLQG
jgi:hypothetical protein